MLAMVWSFQAVAADPPLTPSQITAIEAPLRGATTVDELYDRIIGAVSQNLIRVGDGNINASTVPTTIPGVLTRLITRLIKPVSCDVRQDIRTSGGI